MPLRSLPSRLAPSILLGLLTGASRSADARAASGRLARSSAGTEAPITNRVPFTADTDGRVALTAPALRRSESLSAQLAVVLAPALENATTAQEVSAVVVEQTSSLASLTSSSQELAGVAQQLQAVTEGFRGIA